MGRTALVTGGTGGLGSAVTDRLIHEGWRVVVPWVAESELARVNPHPRLELIEADLFDKKAVAEVVEIAARDADTPLTAVANLVGGFAMGGRMHETSVEDFEHLLRLNLRPMYLTTQAALPHLIGGGGGSVLAISARSAFSPFAGAAAYITAKSAVWALVSSLAVEYKDDGIRVNALLPTVIESAASIADVVAFLFSDQASSITGAQIPVPGVG
jgi:NAD(P)-dependent dehydrogenase (short-subunit alcohol dehydrogenase family)